MSQYLEYKKRRDEKINALPIRYAFSEAQLDAAMVEMGLDPSKKRREITSLGDYGHPGAFCKKSDVGAYFAAVKDIVEEFDALIAADTTGEGFIADMFDYELSNHEYSYTNRSSDTVEALGLSEDIKTNPALQHGLRVAIKRHQDRRVLHEDV